MGRVFKATKKRSHLQVSLLLLGFFSFLLPLNNSFALLQDWKFQKKPNLQDQLSGVKPKTLKLMEEDYHVESNSSWSKGDGVEEDFTFFNGLVIPTSLTFAAPKILDFPLYSQMSDAIEEYHYNPKTNIIEIVGSKAGFHMHSWVKVDQKKWMETDEASGVSELNSIELVFRIIQGDMKNMLIHAYFFDYKTQTLVLSSGRWPGGKKAFSGILSTLFIPVSEAVLGFASGKFRSHIKELKDKK